MYTYDEALICQRKGCINEKATKKYCRKHQDQINKRNKLKRQERKSKGLCKKCNTHRLKNHSLCLYHYFQSLSIRYLNDKHKGPLLYQKFLKQNKTCFFTGLTIEPGNLSIDHLLPQSKYPHLKFDINNLVFCHLIVNQMKRDYPINQFLHFCELVVNHKNTIKEQFNVLSTQI